MDALLNWLWQGGVVALVSSVMLVGLERARANVRCIVCWAAALIVIALPALPRVSSAAVSEGAFRAARVDPFVSLPDVWWTSTFVILAAWTLWTAVQIVRFVSAIVAIRRARVRSRAFPSHVESIMPHWCRVRSDGRRARLVLSDSVATAAVLGCGPPMIAVAPSLVTMLDVDELDRVLIHEWVHVQRRDDLINLLQVVVRIVAGWHPALWWVDRRLHVEREIACDEITVAVTGSAKSYAACLMKIASVRQMRRRMQQVPAVFTPSGLRVRVVKIVSPHPAIGPVWSHSLAAAMVAALCLISTSLGGLKLVEATALALPFIAPLTPGPSVDRLSTPVTLTLRVPVETERSPRRLTRPTSASERSEAEEHPASGKSEAQPNASPTADPNLVESTPAAETRSEHAAQEQEAPVPSTPSAPSTIITEQPQSPWTAAAAGGVAIGRKSKEAGVATAGFFTRFARRVAGSF
jgi:D-alanyl-D-alanine endopeptidase (penicillin-binding protein 7)